MIPDLAEIIKEDEKLAGQTHYNKNLQATF
jgi:hypothetical protein